MQHLKHIITIALEPIAYTSWLGLCVSLGNDRDRGSV